MNSRFTPQRIFWTLLAASAAWAAVGYHIDPDMAQPRWMRSLQAHVIEPVPRTLIIPGEFVFGMVQGFASSAIEHASRDSDPNPSNESLADENRNLRAQIARLNGVVDELRQKNGALVTLGTAGLTSNDVLAATVLGTGAGANSGLLHLDKGSNNGVKIGMVVVAPLEQVTILGRVVEVGTLECTVRLLSDASARTGGDIVRDNVVIAHDAQVQGLGGNLMECSNVNVTPGTGPGKGDLLLLTDGTWPQSVRFMLIGQIESATRRADQPLRYDLRIAPIRSVASMHTVMIVTKQ